MRFGVGLAILGVGVVGLGWWARAEYATHIQTILMSSAQVVAAGSVHGVTPQVMGRDIRVTGLADGPAERATLIARFNAIPGRRVVVDALEVLPMVTPFTLRAIWMDGVLTAEGYAPTQAAQEELAALGAGGLTLAAGAPDTHWAQAAGIGIAVLEQLEHGEIALADRQMSMSGVARTPDEGEAARAVLDTLPAGYQSQLGLSYLDDGAPPDYSLSYTAADGGSVEGKLPTGLDAATLAAALGVNELENNATQGLIGDPGQVPVALSALSPWMLEIETLDVSVAPEGTEIIAGFGKGADLELLRAALAADMAAAGSTASVSVVAVEASGAEGAQRVNHASGDTEELRRGYWLPVVGFAPDAASCAAETDSALAAHRIGFVTGSARLDAHARSAVNDLAAVLGACLRDAGLHAEIGGHTDATGGEAANLTLSLDRAEAVRAALVARGVPEAGLTAQGYGATEPVAGNDTEAGRAANRRTAVRWIE